MSCVCQVAEGRNHDFNGKGILGKEGNFGKGILGREGKGTVDNSLKDMHKVIRNAGNSGRKSIIAARGGQDFKRTAGILKGKMSVSEDEASKFWLRKSLNFVTIWQEMYWIFYSKWSQINNTIKSLFVSDNCSESFAVDLRYRDQHWCLLKLGDVAQPRNLYLAYGWEHHQAQEQAVYI